MSTNLPYLNLSSSWLTDPEQRQRRVLAVPGRGCQVFSAIDMMFAFHVYSWIMGICSCFTCPCVVASKNTSARSPSFSNDWWRTLKERWPCSRIILALVCALSIILTRSRSGTTITSIHFYAIYFHFLDLTRQKFINLFKVIGMNQAAVPISWEPAPQGQPVVAWPNRT